LTAELSGEGEGTIKAEIITAIEELQASLENVQGFTDKLDGILLDAQPRIEAILGDIEGATSSIEDATSNVTDLIADPELTESIKSTITNLEQATEEVLNTIKEIEELVSDEELKGDIKELLSSAKDTMEKASESVEKAQGALDVITDTDVGGEFRMRYLTEPERVASDFDLFVAPGQSNMLYRLGVEDIGEGDDISFQLGYGGRRGLIGRFGIKRGQLGAGFDYRADPFLLRGDVYDPNDLHFDIYGGYAISEDFRFIIGLEDIYDEDFFHFGIGIEF
jgi:hypothetical protein